MTQVCRNDRLDICIKYPATARHTCTCTHHIIYTSILSIFYAIQGTVRKCKVENICVKRMTDPPYTHTHTHPHTLKNTNIGTNIRKML